MLIIAILFFKLIYDNRNEYPQNVNTVQKLNAIMTPIVFPFIEYIIRNISVKEMSYSKLTSIGFSFSNEWNMSPNQSDIVGQYMGKPLFEINDLVYL